MVSAELTAIRPSAVVLLDATAATSLLGAAFKPTAARGKLMHMMGAYHHGHLAPLIWAARTGRRDTSAVLSRWLMNNQPNFKTRHHASINILLEVLNTGVHVRLSHRIGQCEACCSTWHVFIGLSLSATVEDKILRG